MRKSQKHNILITKTHALQNVYIKAYIRILPKCIQCTVKIMAYSHGKTHTDKKKVHQNVLCNGITNIKINNGETTITIRGFELKICYASQKVMLVMVQPLPKTNHNNTTLNIRKFLIRNFRRHSAHTCVVRGEICGTYKILVVFTQQKSTIF